MTEKTILATESESTKKESETETAFQDATLLEDRAELLLPAGKDPLLLPFSVPFACRISWQKPAQEKLLKAKIVVRKKSSRRLQTQAT